MIETLRAAIGADTVSARFLVLYVGVLLGLYALSLCHVLIFPRAQPRPDAGRRPSQSRIQAAAKTAAVRFGNWVASLAITPNQITVVGLVLVAFCCALFLYHRNTFIFGSSLIVAYLFDTLDGVVARAQGKSSKFGGYLDAVVDRYQEVVTFLAIGVVTGLWAPVFLVITGSMLTSYNKARSAMEVEIDNKAWPDLLEKPVRLFMLCVALIGNTTLGWMLPGTLWALAVMTHFTALQRIVRSYILIRAAPRGRTGG